MRFLKKIPYKLKTALPALALAGGAMMASCEKEEPENFIPIDVEVNFSNTDLTLLLVNIYDTNKKPSNTLINYINNKKVRYIYIVPIGNLWGSYIEKNIKSVKNDFLIPILEFSPKIRGKGNFNFMPGEASKIPEDSLWFIQNGWTINKDLQKQR